MPVIDTDHPAWRVAGGTVLSYVLVLALITVVFFLLPYAVVSIFH